MSPRCMMEQYCPKVSIIMLYRRQEVPDLKYILLVSVKNLIHEVCKPNKGVSISDSPIEETAANFSRVCKKLFENGYHGSIPIPAPINTMTEYSLKPCDDAPMGPSNLTTGASLIPEGWLSSTFAASKS
mmetsp:Transcript_15135/g.32861  ORF Transcript_15135/g.32861 Transcript_15135/m.32861 type:complete len:129 (+) Transcript_15135:332-718(+)